MADKIFTCAQQEVIVQLKFPEKPQESYIHIFTFLQTIFQRLVTLKHNFHLHFLKEKEKSSPAPLSSLNSPEMCLSGWK